MPTLIPPERIDDFIGIELEPTHWLEIDQQRVNNFAECTMDRQFIHTDPEAAMQTPFGGTIAHGFLTLSLLSHFVEKLDIQIEGMQMVVNYGLEKVRFIHPVKVGSRVCVRTKICDISEKKQGQYLVRLQATMDIEGEARPAFVAECLFLQLT